MAGPNTNAAITSNRDYRPLGTTGLRVPPIVWGAGPLGNAGRVLPEQAKFEICAEWLKRVAPPVMVHVHGEPRVVASSLDILKRALTRLDVATGEVIIHLSVRISESPGDVPARDHVLEAWRSACRRLGDHRPKLVSIEPHSAQHPPSPEGREPNQERILEAFAALQQLKSAGEIAGVGLVEWDLKAAQAAAARVELDWLMLVGAYTILHHPPDLTQFIEQHSGRIPLILGGAFGGGFLVGGDCWMGRIPRPEIDADQRLFSWRKSFVSLCQGHGVTPAQACIQFALCAPGVVAVAATSSSRARVTENVAAVLQEIPRPFWESMREERLLDHWPT